MDPAVRCATREGWMEVDEAEPHYLPAEHYIAAVSSTDRNVKRCFSVTAKGEWIIAPEGHLRDPAICSQSELFICLVNFYFFYDNRKN